MKFREYLTEEGKSTRNYGKKFIYRGPKKLNLTTGKEYSLVRQTDKPTGSWLYFFNDKEIMDSIPIKDAEFKEKLV